MAVTYKKVSNSPTALTQTSTSDDKTTTSITRALAAAATTTATTTHSTTTTTITSVAIHTTTPDAVSTDDATMKTPLTCPTMLPFKFVI